jgi:selenium metabolism protein YedF
MLIDARGQACPGPVMMADEALSRLQEGIVEVIVDNEESALNVAGFASQHAFFAETMREGKDWRVKIVKGYLCKTPGSDGVFVPSKPEKKQTLLLVISTDIMGRDEELGKILMKSFFETIKTYKQLPHTIFFMNTGVYLTTINEEMRELLKSLEAMGVEIYSCGTCLNKFNLETALAVGKRGTTNTVVEGMQDFEKTVWV